MSGHRPWLVAIPDPSVFDESGDRVLPPPIPRSEAIAWARLVGRTDEHERVLGGRPTGWDAFTSSVTFRCLGATDRRLASFAYGAARADYRARVEADRGR